MPPLLKAALLKTENRRPLKAAQRDRAEIHHKFYSREKPGRRIYPTGSTI